MSDKESKILKNLNESYFSTTYNKSECKIHDNHFSFHVMEGELLCFLKHVKNHYDS
jgi:hypothetical protein